MRHRIRHAMHTGTFNKLSGQAEADETFIGGKARNMHAGERGKKITGTGPKDKTILICVIERGGEVRAAVVPTRRKADVQAHVREHVFAGSALFTDALKSYEGLSEFQHEVIDHAVPMRKRYHRSIRAASAEFLIG
jgi:transposase-like protein